MNRNTFYFSLLSLAVAGCSSINNKQASGGFDYANQKEAKHLTIPSGLSAPEKKQTYAISDDINHQGPIGKNVDIRAPSLVLPIAASSRIEGDNNQAKIWFDQVLENTDLHSFIYQAVEEQLKSDGVAIDVIDAENKIFESQWYNREKESGFWLFKDVESTESLRFRYQFETKPHGRSVAVIVSLVDYMKTDESGGVKEMNQLDKQRAEMAMLNEIVAQVDFKYRKHLQENRLLRASQKLVTIGQNKLEEPAYIVEMELDLLWSNMPLFFEDHGFKVSDLNETKKIYYVDFVKPDISLWDKIWGDELPVIELIDQRYQFVLSPKDKQTTVTIYDADGNVIPLDKLELIFPVMESGLSFRNTF
ncbi:MAG: outer membrane protein assembly factor BamC [Colwelliaceae bacterium]|nr:outer membrane protein assembly factor BamC [Colwelliaceae bacterium]